VKNNQRSLTPYQQFARARSFQFTYKSLHCRIVYQLCDHQKNNPEDNLFQQKLLPPFPIPHTDINFQGPDPSQQIHAQLSDDSCRTTKAGVLNSRQGRTVLYETFSTLPESEASDKLDSPTDRRGHPVRLALRHHDSESVMMPGKLLVGAADSEAAPKAMGTDHRIYRDCDLSRARDDPNARRQTRNPSQTPGPG
jgi:hypothetical protein